MASRSLMLSLVSGFLAAMASVLGKLGMANDRAAAICQKIFSSLFETSNIEAFYMCESVSSFLCGALFLLMIVCNALMWTVFTKALRSSASTVEVTIVNLAANFFSSAIFGHTFFAEKLTLMWFLGSVIIILGLALMHVGSKHNNEHNQRRVQGKNCDIKYPGSDNIYKRHQARKAQ